MNYGKFLVDLTPYLTPFDQIQVFSLKECVNERNFERGCLKKITCLTCDDETDPQPKDFKLDHMQMVPRNTDFSNVVLGLEMYGRAFLKKKLISTSELFILLSKTYPFLDQRWATAQRTQ